MRFENYELKVNRTSAKTRYYGDYPYEHKSEEEVITDMQMGGVDYIDLPDEAKRVKNITWAGVELEGWLINHIPKQFQNDKDVALAALHTFYEPGNFPKKFVEDRNFLLSNHH